MMMKMPSFISTPLVINSICNSYDQCRLQNITPLPSTLIFPEPIKMKGEGKYNLNNVKQIVLTDSYHGLNINVKRCQNEEDVNDCTTRKFLDKVLQLCKCLPFSIRTSHNVSKCLFVSITLVNFQDPICSPEQLKCLQIHNLKTVDTPTCIQKCNGLMVTSFSKTGIIKDPEELIPIVMKEYKRYKNRFKPTSNPEVQGFYKTCYLCL